MSLKITPLEFEDQVYTIDINSPMHSRNKRSKFISPKPVLKPLAVRPTSPLTSALGKRDFIIAFDDDAEEQRYGQKIESNFFATNTGHGVFSPIKAEEEPVIAVQKMQAAADSVIQDFRADLSGFLRRQRDSESKYDIEELFTWCEFYRNNRNLFNV